MVYRFKHDDDDSSEIKKQQDLYVTFKNGSDTVTVTANEQQRAKELDNMKWILDGSQKEKAKAANTPTTTTTESSSSEGFLEMAKTVGVVGGAALAAGWGLYSLLSSPSPSPSPSSSKKKEKMMKAPGRKGEYIPRKPFTDNPRDYFQDLHNSKRKQ